MLWGQGRKEKGSVLFYPCHLREKKGKGAEEKTDVDFSPRGEEGGEEGAEYSLHKEKKGRINNHNHNVNKDHGKEGGGVLALWRGENHYSQSLSKKKVIRKKGGGGVEKP